jgi:16S rRNA (guanine1207-N2)-methyltransferase
MSTSPLSSFLQRQLPHLSGKKLLVCGQLQDIELDPLLRLPDAQFLMTDFGVYTNYQSKYPNAALHWALEPDDHDFTAILLFFPKAKKEALFWLQQTLPHLQAHAEIYLIGENNGGIKSAASLLKPWAAHVQKVDSARHCLFMQTTIERQPEVTDPFQTYSFPLQSSSLTIAALPGVFSATELDEGTQLLLQTLPKLSGAVLDVGCGAGIIGCALAKQNTAINSITMCDISLLAVHSARRTAELNDVSATILPSDMFSAIQGTFDYIVTNPPFHAGLNTYYAATERLLVESKQHLGTEGHLYLVANKFLPYENIIKKTFPFCEIVQETGRFKIIHAYSRENELTINTLI